jgi:Tol biopolymer transport system component
MLTRSIAAASLLALTLVSGAGASPGVRQAANGRMVFGSSGMLIVTNPDGTGRWPLTRRGSPKRTASGYSPGDWSPDGTRLALVGYGDSHRASIYLTNPRWRNTVRLTSTDSDGEYDPSFSPDGSLIAYESFKAGRDPQIWVMNADGTSQHLLPTNVAAEDPDWSPDGKHIAWTSYISGDPEIWVMRTDGHDGSERRRLTYNAGVEENPSWSPDGTRIAFDSDRGGNLDVYTMKVDGTDVRQLTTSPALDAIPEWSPDGRRIAFVSERSGHRALFVMNADGSRETQLSQAADRSAGAAWQPVERRPPATTTAGRRCTIWGTEAGDLLVGTPGHDVICGLGGDDRILGGEGDDVLVGGPGDDSIVGGPGADFILGGPGGDEVDARDRDADTVDGGRNRNIALVDRALDGASNVARSFDPDPGNLTRGRPVRASSASLAAPVEYAVDGYTHTYWDPDHYTNAWLEIDLGRGTTIGRLEFTLSQGESYGHETVHLLVLGKRLRGHWGRLATFQRERRRSGQALRYKPARPWRNLRWIRVVTRTDGFWEWGELRAYTN